MAQNSGVRKVVILTPVTEACASKEHLSFGVRKKLDLLIILYVTWAVT